MLHVRVEPVVGKEATSETRGEHATVLRIVLDHARGRGPMTNRSDHVLADAEPGNGVFAGEDRLVVGPEVVVIFGCPNGVECLLQPAVAEGKGLVARKLRAVGMLK